GAQIRPPERDFCNVGGGQPHFGDDPAVRGVAPCPPTAPQADPDMTFRVAGRTIGPSVRLVDGREDAGRAERTVVIDRHLVDHAAKRVRMIERAAVGADGRTVGDAYGRQAAVADQPFIEAIKPTAATFLSIRSE